MMYGILLLCINSARLQQYLSVWILVFSIVMFQTYLFIFGSSSIYIPSSRLLFEI